MKECDQWSFKDIRLVVNWLVVVFVILLWTYKQDNFHLPQLIGWLGALTFLSLVLSFSWSLQTTAGLFFLGTFLASVLSAFLGILQWLDWALYLPCCVSEDNGGQVFANLRQRNLLSTLLCIGVIIVLVQPCTATFRIIGVRFALLLATIFALSATSSRTGAIQIFVIVGWLCFNKSKKGKLWAICLATVFLCSVVATGFAGSIDNQPSSGLLARFDDPNALSRIALWSNLLELIAEQPWTGHGWRSLAYAHYSAEFSGARFMEMLDNAHNLPLHLAVELGLPVALAFCAAMAWCVWRGRPWAETRQERLIAWGILLVIGIHSMVEYPLWYGPFFLTAVLCVMILLQDWVSGLKQRWSLAGIKAARNAVHLIAIMLLAFTAFAAFDYHRVSQIYMQPEDRSRWYADDALGAAQKSVLFKSHAKFAELVITPITRASAPRVLQLASEMVHWSPEPRVIEKLIESAVMMELDDLAAFHLHRYRVAYPAAYSAWMQKAGVSSRSLINSGL